jgi:uncharacterized protein (TIGR00255 family)
MAQANTGAGDDMKSMTGYAALARIHQLNDVRLDLDWDLRAVNGRALDIRLRVPEAIVFAEKTLRDVLAAGVARGNVTLSLRMRVTASSMAPMLDLGALDTLLESVAQVTERAQQAGVQLSPPTALDLLQSRSVTQSGQDAATFETESLLPLLVEDTEALLTDFNRMRTTEGAALAATLRAQADAIGALALQARNLLGPRAQAMRAHLDRVLAQMAENTRIDPARLEQELALAALKADVTEELDRLDAHVQAARDALDSDLPVGRKLDFLMQEFNREANTLCSKAQHLDLTRLGLEMKGLIDQMREQVQNLE